jgi:AAA ATPase domain
VVELEYAMARRAKKTYLPQRKRRAGATRSASPVLQGREQDVALIDHLIDRIDQGGSTLVISGEPGIGKSALLEVAKRRASNRGVSVLSMTGILAEVHLPFAALEQALRPLKKRAVGLVPRQRCHPNSSTFSTAPSKPAKKMAEAAAAIVKPKTAPSRTTQTPEQLRDRVRAALVRRRA